MRLESRRTPRQRFGLLEATSARNSRRRHLAEGLKAYREARNELVDFVNTRSENLRGRLLRRSLTDMDGHQIFLFIAAHSDRHTLQVEGIKRVIG